MFSDQKPVIARSRSVHHGSALCTEFTYRRLALQLSRSMLHGDQALHDREREIQREVLVQVRRGQREEVVEGRLQRRVVGVQRLGHVWSRKAFLGGLEVFLTV